MINRYLVSHKMIMEILISCFFLRVIKLGL
jgi:hypothetical protein